MSSRCHGLRYPSLAALALLSVALARPAQGQPPAAYYDGVDASGAAVLRSTLHEAIDDHLRRPYTSANIDTWDVLKLADEDPSDPGRILDLYQNASYPKAEGENDFYEREHVWPNSYGFPDDRVSNQPYTDCHGLFLAYGSYNGSRGRMPLRACGPACEEKPTEENDGRGGSPGTGYPGWSNWRTGSPASATGTWEVWRGRRGDVARALFYFDVRYEGGFHGGTGDPEPDLVLTDDQNQIRTTDGNTEGTAYMGMLADLLAWHGEDPVDARERQRNETVYSFQDNRNPFVDHPEWVACLWQGACPPPPCDAGADAAFFADGRFRVDVCWKVPEQGTEGTGKLVPGAEHVGAFYFFQVANPELYVKVKNACVPPFDRYWFFAAALTNVEVTLTVTDGDTGLTRTYHSPAGQPFASIQDTDSFAVCL